MSLLRPERRQAFPEPPIPPFPGMSLFGGTSLTMLRAMQSSTVWACVRLIASTVAMMPLGAYTMRDGVRMPVSPTPPLLIQPSAKANLPDWLYMIVVSLLLRGNAYGQIVRRDARQYPLQIELLNPDDVTVDYDRDGKIRYRVKGTVIPTVDMYHVRGYRMPGLDVGLSPIQQAALTIDRDRAIQTFALGYFQDAPHPAQVLTSDQPINDNQARTIKERLKAAVTGREPLVLGAGLKLNPMAISPNESQFLETQKYGAAEICRFFGVPPQKIAAADVGSSMTYSTPESSGIDLLIYTIQWWLTTLEASLYPLMPGQRHVRFDPSVLLRTDLETQMKASAIGIASKQLTPDEARAMRDAPPLTDEQKQDLALVPLDVGPNGTPKLISPGAVNPNTDEAEGAPAA